MPDRRYIADFGVSERIEGAFAISNAQMGRTRNDKSYLRCLLSDKSGEVSGRMWSIDEAQFRRLPTDGFVYIEGETQAYQGDLQLIIHAIDPIEPTPEQIAELLPSTTKDVAQMFEQVKALLDSLKHPAAKALAAEYLADEFLMDHFRRAPAAKSMHHAYLGGLLEHTLQLLNLANLICPLYPKLNRDIVVLGLFLHDLGKTRELKFDQTFTYSDRGELIGHIVEGAIILHDKAQQVVRNHSLRLPPGMLTVLQHIILSHHGIPEYGAAKIPSTPEAVLVSILDNLDAKTTIAIEAARPTRAKAVDLGGNFTDKHWALGTKMFRPDVLGE